MNKQEELVKLEILKKYAYSMSSESYAPSVRVEALKAYSMLLNNQIELDELEKSTGE